MYRIYGCYDAHVGGKNVKISTLIATADKYNKALEIIDKCTEYKSFEIKED